jgi:hypothetical protein
VVQEVSGDAPISEKARARCHEFVGHGTLLRIVVGQNEHQDGHTEIQPRDSLQVEPDTAASVVKGTW